MIEKMLDTRTGRAVVGTIGAVALFVVYPMVTAFFVGMVG